jgi:tryptophan synthase alpha chain
MNNFSKAFARVRAEKRAAFMPFLVAGDPDVEKSLAAIRLVSKHADMLELGFPYSDPLADGPTIQAADQRALRSGMTTDKVFELVEQTRAFTDVPITVLVYANLVYQQGIKRFYERAKEAGIDGVLVPDVPLEEAKPFVAAARTYGIDPIFLVAQTTTSERLEKILKRARGYLYLVSVLGVTGKREVFSRQTVDFIRRVRKETTLPLAVGFGISTRKQAKEFAKAGADGVIVGSALVDLLQKEGTGSSVDSFLKQFSRVPLTPRS